MGKTKTKIIDDSASEAEEKNTKKAVKSESAKTAVKTDTTEEAVTQKNKIQSKKAAKSKLSKKRSQKYQEAFIKVDRNKNYPVAEAIDLAKEISYTKFPATLEAHINTKSANLRGLVSMPYASGKKLTILAFGKDAEKSGADIVGSEEVVEEILKGKINFDVVVTSADWMPKLARAAKILGPRGMMPNPKNGTITQNLEKTVAEFKGGKSEYKTEPKGKVVHIAVGKTTQPSEEIAANIKALYTVIGRSRIQKITLAATMGPGVKVELSSLNK